MILCDTSALIAVIDRRDARHQSCLDVVYAELEFATTTVILTEAFHFLGRIGGWHFQKTLWQMLHRQVIEVIPSDLIPLSRVGALMEQYHDLPMDFADATLVVAAETAKTHRIFTLDSDFTVYRTYQNRSFDIVPESSGT